MRVGTGVFRLVLLWTLLIGSACAAGSRSDWPEWNAFVDRFVQADGRVVDLTFERKSTSEGQSYALFLALVANDRPLFDKVLAWTSDNLAAGQLGTRLPAWLWGQRADGSWGVKDSNAASDADLWIAYALLEAARLWKSPEYAETGRKLLAQIQRQETAQAGRAGTVLLPGPVGFKLDKDRYRLNPSYQPGFMFRYLAVVDPQGPWQEVWDGYMKMAPTVFSAGVAPDLIVVDGAGTVMPDTERAPSGSYDAIRVYLWAGMSGSGSQGLLRLLPRYAELTRATGVPPEKVNPQTGIALRSNYSPLGFSGAVLPYLSAIGDTPTLEKQRERIRVAAARAGKGEATNYYDQVLILFGAGWLEGRYRFDDQGRVLPKWVR